MKTRTFDNATTIIVMLNRITGVRTLNYSNTWFWLFLSLLYKAILMSFFLYSLYFDWIFYETLTANYLGPVVYMTVSILGYLSVFTMQVLGWNYYKEMTLLRQNIAETEQFLNKMNVAIDHRNIYIWIIVICTASAINAFLYCVIYVQLVHLLKEHTILIFTDAVHSVIFYIGGMVILDFMSHVCWLERSFKKTNDLLKHIFIDDYSIETEDFNNKCDTSWLQKCLNELCIQHFFRRKKITQFRRTRIIERQLCTMDKISMLQQIRYIHLQLCLIMKLLNKLFSTQIMLYSVLTIHGIIATLYYAYTQSLVIENPRDYNSLSILSFYTFDACYVWLKIVATCYICEKTAKEAKQIVHIIHVCSIRNFNIELKNELIQFCLQISLTEMDCKDTHLFWLNDGFILQSLGGIFTYLLVLIQWSQTIGISRSSSNLTTSN